jgi:hypothetical protein
MVRPNYFWARCCDVRDGLSKPKQPSKHSPEATQAYPGSTRLDANCSVSNGLNSSSSKQPKTQLCRCRQSLCGDRQQPERRSLAGFLRERGLPRDSLHCPPYNGAVAVARRHLLGSNGIFCAEWRRVCTVEKEAVFHLRTCLNGRRVSWAGSAFTRG